MLQIQKTVKDGEADFILKGEMDTTSAPALQEALEPVLPGLHLLTLDLGGVNYLSSACLRLLLASSKIMKKQGRMRLTNVQDNVMQVLDVTGFSKIMDIE